MVIDVLLAKIEQLTKERVELLKRLEELEAKHESGTSVG